MAQHFIYMLKTFINFGVGCKNDAKKSVYTLFT